MYNKIFSRPNRQTFSNNESPSMGMSMGRTTGYGTTGYGTTGYHTDLSPWQYHVNHHTELSKYKHDLAQYHQQKMQYYQQMARVSPWGWWYKMKAMHHQDLVKQHQRAQQLHQAKKMKYLMKINKDTLGQLKARLK